MKYSKLKWKNELLGFTSENDIRKSEHTIFLVGTSVKWQHSPPSKSNMHKSRPLPLRYYVNRSDLWSYLRDFHKGEYRQVNSIERNSRIYLLVRYHRGELRSKRLPAFYCVFDVFHLIIFIIRAIYFMWFEI